MLVAPVIAIPKPPSDAVAQQMCDEWGCRCVHAKNPGGATAKVPSTMGSFSLENIYKNP